MNLLNNIFYFKKNVLRYAKSQFPGHPFNIKPENIRPTWTNITALFEITNLFMQRYPENSRQIQLG